MKAAVNTLSRLLLREHDPKWYAEQLGIRAAPHRALGQSGDQERCVG
jgi:hypothetical protein